MVIDFAEYVLVFHFELWLLAVWLVSACGAQNCCILQGALQSQKRTCELAIPQRIAVSEVTETGRTLVHDMMRLVPFAFSVDQKFIERVREGEREVSITRLVCWLSSIAAPSKCNLQLPHAQTIYLPALTNKRSILESMRVEKRKTSPRCIANQKISQDEASRGRVRRTHAQPIS